MGGALLSEGEARIIFGNVKAIYEVHVTILAELVKCAENWSDADTLIGPIFSERVSFHLEGSFHFSCVTSVMLQMILAFACLRSMLGTPTFCLLYLINTSY